MKAFPSTSVTIAPFAFATNRGVPPTDRKARTGELTPPGISCCACRNSFFDAVVFIRALLLRDAARTGFRKDGELYPLPGRGVKGSIRLKSKRFSIRRKTIFWYGL